MDSSRGLDRGRKTRKRGKRRGGERFVAGYPLLSALSYTGMHRVVGCVRQARVFPAARSAITRADNNCLTFTGVLKPPVNYAPAGDYYSRCSSPRKLAPRNAADLTRRRRRRRRDAPLLARPSRAKIMLTRISSFPQRAPAINATSLYIGN